MGKTSAVGYIVLVPDIYGSGNSRYVSSIRIDRVRAGKPALESGEIAFRLKLNFDDGAVLAAIPTIELDVASFVTAPVEPETVEVAV